MPPNCFTGFIIVLNGQTLEEVARGTAPDKTLFGLHNRFFQRPASKRGGSEMSGASSSMNSLVVLLLSWIVLLVN